MTIRVVIPPHLRTLAKITAGGGEVLLDVNGPVTQRSVLDALEAQYPMLAAPFAITSPNSGVHFCASSPARKISRTSRPTLRCPTP